MTTELKLSPDRIHTKSVLYLSSRDVEEVGFPFRAVARVVEKTLSEKANGDVVSPPKQEILMGSGATFRSMLASVPSLQAVGAKWITAHPKNAHRRVPTIHATIILTDPETGQPFALMDGAWITAVRTAAATLVAARVLANPESETVGILACGRQGRHNLMALCSEFPIRRVKAYDTRRGNALSFALEMGDRLNIDAEAVEAPQLAVSGMDIVVTSAPIEQRPMAPIGSGELKAGALACLLDFDASFRPSAIREADLFVVDDRLQFQSFQNQGYLGGIPSEPRDLGDIAAGMARGRRSPLEKTICMNLGLGALDVAVAKFVYDRACKKEIGQWLRA